MASTRDYLEYLNQRIDIAPVNSEEEYQAAGLIEALMQSHGLETRLQDFDAHGWGELPYRICGILLFLGAFLSGILGTPAAIVGELLVLACIVLLGLRYLGIANPIGNLGATINSQNVIGIHRATGPLVAKGSRPIVIVAHYDTPRENLLYAPPFDRWQRLLRRYAPQCTCVAAVLSFFQTFAFVPAGIRHLFWVVAIVAALPQLVVGIAAIHERFAPCTEGSNDNKSGVAAMLGIMSMVHPGNDEATGFGAQRELRDQQAAERLAREVAEAEALAAAEAEREAAELAEAEELLDEGAEAEILSFAEDEAAVELDADLDEPSETLVTAPVVEELILTDADDVAAEPAEGWTEDAPLEYGDEYDELQDAEYADDEPQEEEPAPQVVTRREVQVERVEGVRHGRETLEALHILPEGCEIVYLEPQERVRTYEEVIEPGGVGAGILMEDAYDDYPEYEDEYDEGEYWGEQEDQGGFLGRVRGMFSNVRQSISDRLAARRERKEAEAGEEYAFGEEPEDALEVLDAVIEDEDLAFEGEAFEDEDVAVEGEEPDLADDAEQDAAEGETPADVLIFEGSTATEGVIPVVSVDDDVPAPVAPVVVSEEDALLGEVHAVVDGDDAAEDGSTLPFVPLGELIDGREVDEQGDSKDATGLDTLAQDGTVIMSRGADAPAAPAPVDDPDWGKSSFRPEVSDVARRAVLFDLPDPMGGTGESDPLSGSLDATAPTHPTGEWKGGAAQRSDLRVVGDDDVRVQDDLREAILGMGDDELVAHDIWFVALGGSHANQAGIKAFLEDNRRSVRGCFLVNLDCVGSGQLSVLTHEGLAGTRRADRRIVRLLDQVAADLHIDLLHTRHDWEDTDATPAMRSSLRCATICGVTADDELALSKVSGDEPDLVDPEQTTLVSDLVAELIRRS